MYFRVFSYGQGSSGKVSVTVSKFNAFFPHITGGQNKSVI